MEGIDIHAVAHPLHSLAIHRRDNSAELRDGTRRRVISGYPLRVQKYQLLCSGLNRNILMHGGDAVDIVAEVDHELHGSDIGSVDRGCDGRWHGIRLWQRLRSVLRQQRHCKGGGGNGSQAA